MEYTITGDEPSDRRISRFELNTDQLIIIVITILITIVIYYTVESEAVWLSRKLILIGTGPILVDNSEEFREKDGKCQDIRCEAAEVEFVRYTFADYIPVFLNVKAGCQSGRCLRSYPRELSNLCTPCPNQQLDSDVLNNLFRSIC